jgi:NAD(P)-dependent dehydrogenase (short-subunit alcohol dehydrogenase family)
MRNLAGRVAVITGAGSGIGLALAKRLAEMGMSLALADIEAGALDEAEAAIKPSGARTIAVRTDVSREDDVGALADATFEAFGNVHLLCNNAGVGGASGGAPIWDAPLEDFQWVFGVNFMGVLYGLRAFLPRMIANDDEGHVVNTASMAGLLAGASPYSISKHSVVSLTEGLFTEFRRRGTKLSATVVCPGMVDARIVDSQRNRPARYGPPVELSPEARQQVEQMRKALETGIPPGEVADQVVDAITEGSLYVFPAQPFLLDALEKHLTAMLHRRNPA